MIGDTQGECVSRAGRRIEPNPQVGALLGAVDAHGPAPFFAHRVHVQLREQAEPGPARSRASGGEPRRCHGRECEPFGDRRFDPIGDEFERLPPRRVRRGRVPQVLRPPELSDGLNLQPLPAATQERDRLVVVRIHHEHQVFAVLPLDMGVEEPVRLTIHEGRDQRGLQHVVVVHHVVERGVEDAGRPADIACGAKGDLAPELAQRGVGEQEAGRRDS